MEMETSRCWYVKGTIVETKSSHKILNFFCGGQSDFLSSYGCFLSKNGKRQHSDKPNIEQETLHLTCILEKSSYGSSSNETKMFSARLTLYRLMVVLSKNDC